MAILSACAARPAATTYPVYIVDPPFNNERIRFKAGYEMLIRADRPWRIAVVIPHVKDDYWTGVLYGLTDAAKKLGVGIEILEAGGYEYLDVQRAQVKALITDLKPDGLIISAVSSTGLSDLVEMAHAAGIPVVDLINGIESPFISSRVASSFVDHGEIVGERIAQLADKMEGAVAVAWFPGPDGAGWVAAANKGLMDVLAGTAITVHGPYYGDTGHSNDYGIHR
jgi:periplasmic protein TorT